MGSGPERENVSSELLKSKRALERRRRAQVAVRAAGEAKDCALRVRHLTTQVEVVLAGGLHRAKNKGEDPEEISGGERVEYFKEVNERRVIVLEGVKSETVVIWFASTADEFDKFAPEAQKVVDSVKWGGS